SQMEIVQSILEKLEKDLPEDLYYHNYNHTISVFKEAILFAVYDGLSEREIELLAIASAYHDAGFLFQREDNESIAARLVAEEMKKTKQYENSEIKLVQEMIEDTKLFFEENSYKRNCSNKLSKYLLDADLSNLGRDDFLDNA